MDADRLLVDERFHVHLAQYHGDELPYRCIARAGFRVTEGLTTRATSKVRAGLLGDTRLVIFMNRPAAVGVMLPLAQARWRWVHGLGLDGALSLTAGAAFDDASITRAGVGFSTSIYWGPDPIAPRLLSIGVMLHAATGTHENKPTVSMFAGINLSTLLDAAGGR